ncbi:MAG TPA: phosphate ABC transporter permease PtsA [Gammaproteobacteria bacterium]|nr:phosphate ABC transporter permease PtsA [Gammaproteobacteria bacterium]
MNKASHVSSVGRSPSRLNQRRFRAERRFRRLGLLGVVLALASVVFLLGTIFSSGYSAFWRLQFAVDIQFDPALMKITERPTAVELQEVHYLALFRKNLERAYPEVKKRSERRKLAQMFSESAPDVLRELVLADPTLVGETRRVWVLASSSADMIRKGNAPRDIEEKRRVLTDQQLAWLDQWEEEGLARNRFNTRFFTSGPSRSPELAGLAGAIVGSALTLLVTLIISFPVGVAAAVYLEEYAPKNRISEIIEVNINNLAAVPSIIFGLLGLAVLLNFFGLPRGTPLVGGIVLSLMTLPTIIIASRAALKAVPPSIRDGALAMGASPMQTVFHHVLPLAMPGMLTGTIIGLAQALGETAPLLMIGMFAFVADVPSGIVDQASSLPVQIYLWAESSERGYVELTAAGIMVILIFLVLMNLLAVFLRKKFERRW